MKAMIKVGIKDYAAIHPWFSDPATRSKMPDKHAQMYKDYMGTFDDYWAAEQMVKEDWVEGINYGIICVGEPTDEPIKGMTRLMWGIKRKVVHKDIKVTTP